MDQERTCTLSEFFFLVYFCLLSIAKAIGLDDGQMAYYALVGIGLFFLILKILSTEHSVFEYLWMMLLMILGLVIYRATGQKGMLICFTVLAGMKNVSTRRVFRAGIVVWGSCFAALWLLSMTGVLKEQVWMHDKHGIGLTLCHSMGYPHSNVMHVVFLIVAMMACYLYERRDTRGENNAAGKLYHKRLVLLTAFLLVMNVVVFFYSMSYTGVLACGIYLVLNLILAFRKRLTKAEKILLELIFPACLLFICVGPLVIRGRLFDLINKALTTRYYLSYFFLTEQPATLFGQRYNLDYHLTMDSSYIYLLRQYGIIAFALVLALYAGLIRDEIRRDCRSELAMTLGTCIAGTTEQFLFNTSYKNLSLIFAGTYLFYVSGRLESHLPEALRKQKAFLSGHHDMAPFVITDRITRICSRIFSSGNIKKRSFGSLSLLALGICLAWMALPRTKALYVDEDVNELIDRPSYYFTSSDVQQMEKEGNMFYYYRGPDDPVYLYEGSPAELEYARHVLFAGLFSGGASFMITGLFHAISTREKKTKD